MTEMSSSLSRRALISATALSIAVAANDVDARTPRGEGMQRDAMAAFAATKQIDAGVLSVGYAELGRANAPPVILLHGWPYDIHTYAEAALLLAQRGYRVIAPYLRGYGSTRFLEPDGTY